MEIQATWRDPVLINTVGHCAGALLFFVVTVLLVRNWRMHGVRRTKLPLIAAVLALGWNLGSLVVLGSFHTGSGWLNAVETASFSMLTLLPAVLLHVAVQGRHRAIVAVRISCSHARLSAGLDFPSSRGVRFDSTGQQFRSHRRQSSVNG